MTDINYLNSIPLGRVNTFIGKKTSSLMPISFPGLNADSTTAVDALGIIAYHTLTGFFTGEYSTIQGYIASILSILDGNQIAVSYVRSPFVNCIINDSRITGQLGVSSSVGVGANQLIDPNIDFTAIGTIVGDKVKNITTGEVATVTSVFSSSTLILDADIFTVISTPYALTATIYCKILDFETRYVVPGMNFCEYTLKIVQVGENT